MKIETWARFVVVGDSPRCPLRFFKASTLGTARSFQKFWGGRIIKKEDDHD
jgi:hypothetical protein